MTEYLKFRGKAEYTQVYEPDEFRGAVRWKMNFYPESEEELNRLRSKISPNKVVKEGEYGEFIALYRPTTKFIKGKVVNFSPPFIYDEDGNELVVYVNKEGKFVRSFDDPKAKPKRVGDPVLIGNGSDVEITLCVYNTAMGPGNRLESIRIIDLVEYNPPEEKEEESTEDSDGGEEAPW